MKFHRAVSLTALLLAPVCRSADPGTEPAAWQPSAGHAQIAMWPGLAPDVQSVPGPEADTQGAVTNVTRPTMTVYAPAEVELAGGQVTGARIGEVRDTLRELPRGAAPQVYRSRPAARASRAAIGRREARSVGRCVARAETGDCSVPPGRADARRRRPGRGFGAGGREREGLLPRQPAPRPTMLIAQCATSPRKAAPDRQPHPG